jgi:hypothetical protein
MELTSTCHQWIGKEDETIACGFWSRMDEGEVMMILLVRKGRESKLQNPLIFYF